MTEISRAFLEALPKTDLHVHLDGSIRIATLIDLAKEQGIELPAYTEDGLVELVFKEQYNSLAEYLTGFQYCTAVLQRPEALERVAYELALDNQAEGVRYVEVRFAPQLHINSEQSAEDVLQAVNAGLRRARIEFNRRESVRNGDEPPFEYGIIVCALRMFNRHFGEYYRNFTDAHRYIRPSGRLFGLASLELAQMAVDIRDQYGVPIVGLDLAGQEDGYPPNDHVEAFRYAHQNFMNKTVHAGEAYGPESVFQSVTDLYADRIGHGFFLMEPSRISDPNVKDREAYVDRLAQYVADRRILIEVCLTSNLQTIAALRDLSEHNFGRMRKARLSTTFCTDNRTFSHTSVTQELEKAIKYLGVTRKDLRSCIIYGFKRSFFPGTYLRKRQYVRQVIDYYAKIERAFYHGDVPLLPDQISGDEPLPPGVPTADGGAQWVADVRGDAAPDADEAPEVEGASELERQDETESEAVSVAAGKGSTGGALN